MTKYIVKILAVLMVIIAMTYAQVAKAELLLIGTEVSKLNNGNATITWRTNVPTKGTLYYGLKSNSLDVIVDYNVFAFDHQVVVGGLVKDKTYYYKIIIRDKSGNEVEAYTQSFSTKNMKDNVAPLILEKEILQITSNAVALRWLTNEDCKATLTYYVENADHKFDKKTSVGSYKISQVAYIYNLKPRTNYFVKVTVEDKDKNKTDDTFYFNTGPKFSDESVMAISKVEPLSFDASLIQAESATIKWQTSLVAKSFISFGTKPGSHPKKVYADDGKYSQNHEVQLTDLKPNTTYYYIISTTDPLYKKNVTSAEYSFRTTVPTQVLGDKVNDNTNNSSDRDKDGLSDADEAKYGTDPMNTDSDNDGYTDGVEVANKYNPLGYGRLRSQILSNLQNPDSLEKKQEINLRNIMGKRSISPLNWATLLNAYIYGGYGPSDLIKAVNGLKTVHPSIPWAIWSQSNDYQKSY